MQKGPTRALFDAVVETLSDNEPTVFNGTYTDAFPAIYSKKEGTVGFEPTTFMTYSGAATLFRSI